MGVGSTIWTRVNALRHRPGRPALTSGTAAAGSAPASAAPEAPLLPRTAVPGAEPPVAEVAVVPLTGLDVPVPRGLQVAASWAWRVILLAVLLYGLTRLFGFLSEVMIPLAVAVLLAAMLSPVSNRLHSWGLPRAASTAITLFGGLALIAGALTLIITQIVSQSEVLSANVGTGFTKLVDYLQNGPLHLGAQYFDTASWVTRAQTFLKDSTSQLGTYAAEFGAQVGHFVAGFFITLFALFYFLYDGRGIFTFLLKFFPEQSRGKVDRAAGLGWRSLSAYVRATILVALSDAVGVLIAALILGVPVAPALAALVFIGAFVPLVGAFVSGFVAVIVALVALGVFKALLMFAAIILVMQIEGHLLQPLLLGRAVKLHPLAVLLAIAIGIIAGGIVGALLAVPLLAFTKSYIQYLAGASEPAAVRPIRWPVPRRSS
ncbi:MAG: hypothetical protein JWP61_1474 [Friedmanniella sp.]|nr:hypothetical protein [Friedmanniella sp.]